MSTKSEEEQASVYHPLLVSQRSSINCTSQVALVGAEVCPIESLDYEIVENEVLRENWKMRKGVQIVEYTVMKWLLCFFIGVIVSVIGFTTNLAVENIAGIKFVITSNMMLYKRYTMAFLVFFASNLVLTLLASVITAFVAPTAAGSGIPEVKAYLNGVDAPDIFTFRTMAVKNLWPAMKLYGGLVFSVLRVLGYIIILKHLVSLTLPEMPIIGTISAVSSSLLVGKAGPLVHTSACVASLLAQGGSKKWGITWKLLCFFKNDQDRRDLITCGSAAGIAVAFRAPIGGVLFAFEEMASWWRSSLLWISFFTTAVVAIVLRALIDICWRDKCGLFGKGGLIMFEVNSASISYHLVDVPPALLLGAVGGILGSFHNFLLDEVLRLYTFINEKGTVYRILLACVISVFTSCLLFGLPWLASCQPCPSGGVEACPTIGRSGNYKKFQCAPNYYNDLASLIFNTNDDAIKNLFSKNTDAEFQYSSVLVFFITCFFLGIFSYGIVAPSGLFVPVIVTGAAYGRLVGMLVGSHSNLNHGLFAVLGAASFLGGSMRMTVSLCVIILELTNDLLLLPLVMLVLLVSKTVADAFNGNIYDILMKAKGFPYLEAYAEPYMRQLTVADVVTGPLQLFHGIEKVGNIVHVLRTTRHHGFPVIDDTPQSEFRVLYGLVHRDHLAVLLRKKAFLSAPVPADTGVYSHFAAEDFAKKVSGGVDMIKDIELSDDEMEMFIDLHPLTNASPYTVVESMSLAKALMLFREVGLRHLLVIPKHNCGSPVVGILTRHDFMPEHIFRLHPLLLNKRWKKLRFGFPHFLKIF